MSSDVGIKYKIRPPHDIVRGFKTALKKALRAWKEQSEKHLSHPMGAWVWAVPVDTGDLRKSVDIKFWMDPEPKAQIRWDKEYIPYLKRAVKSGKARLSNPNAVIDWELAIKPLANQLLVELIKYFLSLKGIKYSERAGVSSGQVF